MLAGVVGFKWLQWKVLRCQKANTGAGDSPSAMLSGHSHMISHVIDTGEIEIILNAEFELR